MFRMGMVVIFLSISYKCTYQQTKYVNITTQYLRYYDYLNDSDLFYDRLVTVSLAIPNFTGDQRKGKCLSLGVVLDNRRILTSYNPFRNVTKSLHLVEKIYVCFLRERSVTNNVKVIYRNSCAAIVCGRPVIPMMDKEITHEQWHGKDKKHTPLHDLMILAVDFDLDIYTPTSDFYTLDDVYPPIYRNNTFFKVGPIMTKLAKRTDKLRREIRFASLGIYSKLDARMFFRVQTAKYDDRKNVVVNCDEWLPRAWGYFICLWNDEKFFGFSSGSMLFSGRKLFGIGSFAFWRGKHGILVFTDIRYYLEQIEHVCTERDLFTWS